MIPNDIVYVRARVCAPVESFGGRDCVGIEPVSKSGVSVDGAWVFTIPVEWLIPLDEMRKAVRK